MSITISKHAKERYAERIMDRDSKTDIAVFIRDHEDKIQQDIEKMLEYGTLLYEGKSTKNPKQTVGITLNGAWVIIWDTVEFVVITLYCIDLGVGDDVNKAFIESAIKQIDAAKEEQRQVIERVQTYVDLYKELIERNEENIAKYKKVIRDLEKQIAGCREMMQSFAADYEIADNNVREKVELLIGKQHF